MQASPFAVDFAHLEQYVRGCPTTAKVKGMYIDAVLRSVDRAGAVRPTAQRFFAFRDYPLREAMQLTLDAALAIYPNQSPRHGVTQLGRTAYPALATTTVGKVLFSVAGRSFENTLRLCRKAWELSVSPGSADLTFWGEGHATVALRGVWNFTDTYQVGIMLGTLDAFGLQGSVVPMRRGALCDVDLEIRWTPSSPSRK